ncbi:MAG TPA: pitrilysin family protein [Pyrinomonadaceae bacterium]|jgi:predicted Zn-dependent peptidase|nr:pitrilysin family protein [Pyrinomonadaceae bacterium]
MNDEVFVTRLPNGITVLTEHMPGLRSVTAGIWVRRGSRHETPELNGICHFIEHAVFKGTQRRTARDIAVESDRLGGNLDAFTTHEMTGFAVKVADRSLPEAFDLLADLLRNPRFDQVDLDREQKVILEEMKMVEDTPDELLGELFNAAYFPGHALGRPIEGTAETVTSFDRRMIAGFHEREFSPANLVVAAAGNVEHERLVELVEKSFAGSTVDVNGRPVLVEESPAVAAPILIEHKKELEQAHLVIAAPWPDARDHDRYAASLLASVVGGGTSSRLWQTVREERGLAYSVGAGGSTFSDVGVFTIYAGTSPEHLDEVLDLSLAEMSQVVNTAVPDEELKLAKDQALSSILLGLESSSSRVSALARQEIIHGRRISPAESIAQLEAVTPEDMQRVARKFFTSESLALGALGNLNGFSVDRSRLKI